MVNKVILVGNLGKDPEVRHLESGSTVARFSMATNERYKDKNGEYQTITEWHDVIMWRGLAEIAEKILTKGKMVYVEGKLTHRKYQDKDGIDRYVTEVVANTFQLLDRRDSSPAPQAGLPTEEPKQVQSTPEKSDQPFQAEEDDLPF